MVEFKPKAWMRCPLCKEQSPMPDPDAREPVDLTDDELADIWYKESIDWMEFARAVLAKSKEKNNG
jgi:hypothetical protein